ncbi:hypothetical protein OTU49_006798 [Cherax quadricarinatus]|uniref:Uncharacterized protein n=1 Tax=Cherax quadricarinatus TaxID=27406 RepID=A0AAW0WK98_CHEQU
MKKSVNISASEAGSLVQYSLDLLDCDTVFSFTVTTQNTQGKKSKVSNEVHELVSCTSSTPSLSAGAIAGIVIGSLFGVLILIIIVFLCLNRDHLDDLRLWQVLTCKYIRRKKDDNSVYNSAPPNSTRNDIIRSNMLSISGPVRSISDLYSKPNLNSKRISRQKKQDEDDGGFGERRRQYENSQMNALNDSSSQRSSPYPYNSQKTLSINEVGLPPDQDYKKQNINQKAHLNYHNASLNGDNDGSYDNSAYDGYNGMNDYANKPKNIRNNTQV